MMLVSSLPRLIVGHTSCVGLFCFNVVVVWMYNTSCCISGVPAGRECSEKLRRVGNNGCKAVLTGNRGENLRVVGIHSDG